MEANKEKSDDPADHYGGINNMDAVNRNIHLSSEFYPEERCVQNLQETGGNPGKKSGTGLESAAFPVR